MPGSEAGSVENRPHLDISNKLCRTGYGYQLFAKCMLANQKSPYFQDGGPIFKMAAKIYNNIPKPVTISSQRCFLGQIWLILCKTIIAIFFVKKFCVTFTEKGEIKGK